MMLETEAGTALERAQSERALQATHSGLRWDANRSAALSHAEHPRIPRLPLGFALLAADANVRAAAEIVERLKLRRAEASAVTAIGALSPLSATLRRRDAKPSGVVLLLDRFPVAAVAAFAATAPDEIVRGMALRYVEEWRHVKPSLSGDDVIAMGVPEGPHVSRGLQLIRAARLDGWADDRAGEAALIARFAKSIRDAAAAEAKIELHINGS